MFDKEEALRLVQIDSLDKHWAHMDAEERECAIAISALCKDSADQIAHLKGQVSILSDINETLEFHASEHHESDLKQKALMDDMSVLNRQLRDDLLNAQNRNGLSAQALKELSISATRHREALEYMRAHCDGVAFEIATKTLAPHWPEKEI